MRLFLAFLLLTLAGCSKSQTVVIVSAEPMVRSSATNVDVTVYGAEREGEYVQKATKNLPVVPGTFPFEVSVKPDGDAEDRIFKVEVNALDASGNSLSKGRLISGFVPGESRIARIVLWDACQGVTCDGELTCGESGLCVGATIPPESLPPIDERLAVLDGAQPEAGWPDASVADALDGVDADVSVADSDLGLPDSDASVPDGMVDADASLDQSVDADVPDMGVVPSPPANLSPPNGYAINPHAVSFFRLGMIQSGAELDIFDVTDCAMNDVFQCPRTQPLMISNTFTSQDGAYVRFRLVPEQAGSFSQKKVVWRAKTCATCPFSDFRYAYLRQRSDMGRSEIVTPLQVFDGEGHTGESTQLGTPEELVGTLGGLNLTGDSQVDPVFWSASEIVVLGQSGPLREPFIGIKWVTGGDYNNNGTDELVVGFGTEYEVVDVMTSARPTGASTATGACTGDVDGDGVVEFVTADGTAIKVFNWVGGSRGFQLLGSFAASANKLTCAEDLTGDGIADFVFSPTPGVFRVVHDWRSFVPRFVQVTNAGGDRLTMCTGRFGDGTTTAPPMHSHLVVQGIGSGMLSFAFDFFDARIVRSDQPSAVRRFACPGDIINDDGYDDIYDMRNGTARYLNGQFARLDNGFTNLPIVQGPYVGFPPTDSAYGIIFE